MKMALAEGYRQWYGVRITRYGKGEHDKMIQAIFKTSKEKPRNSTYYTKDTRVKTVWYATKEEQQNSPYWD